MRILWFGDDLGFNVHLAPWDTHFIIPSINGLWTRSRYGKPFLLHMEHFAAMTLSKWRDRCETLNEDVIASRWLERYGRTTGGVDMDVICQFSEAEIAGTSKQYSHGRKERCHRHGNSIPISLPGYLAMVDTTASTGA